MATPQSERHFMWLMTIMVAAIVFVIELVVGPISLFKLAVCGVALVVICIALFKRARNRRRNWT